MDQNIWKKKVIMSYVNRNAQISLHTCTVWLGLLNSHICNNQWFYKRKTKTLIRLRKCAVWSESSLPAHAQKAIFPLLWIMCNYMRFHLASKGKKETKHTCFIITNLSFQSHPWMTACTLCVIQEKGQYAISEQQMPWSTSVRLLVR